MEGRDRNSLPWEAYGAQAPPQSMSRDDPAFILLLLLAAHPNLVVDYERMSDVSYAMPDPRMWTVPDILRNNLSDLENMAGMLRGMPSPFEQADPDSSIFADFNAIMGMIAEGSIPSLSMHQREVIEAVEASVRQVLQTAWENFLSMHHHDGASVAVNPLNAPSQNPEHRYFQTEAISPATSSDDDNPAVLTQLQEDISRRMAELSQNVDTNRDHGVWVDQSLRMNEETESEERSPAASEAAEDEHDQPPNWWNDY